MQYLVYRDMLDRVQTALLNGVLSAQAPKPVCQYVSKQGDTVYGCAIGCNLSDATKLAIVLHDQERAESGITPINGMSINHIDQFVRFDDPGSAAQLQRKHDDWATAGERLVTAASGLDTSESLDSYVVNVAEKRQGLINFVRDEQTRLDNEDALDIVQDALNDLNNPDEDEDSVDIYPPVYLLGDTDIYGGR